MLSVFGLSSPILIDQGDKPVKQVVAILWARRGFWVVLNRKDRLAVKANTLDSIIKK